MPEVIRGSRPSLDTGQRNLVGFDSIIARTSRDDGRPAAAVAAAARQQQQQQHIARLSVDSFRRPRKSVDLRSIERPRTDRPEDRPPADAYYDSRAATKLEFKRRATTLAQYYQQNPKLLPQLPFTWHHGWRRVKLGLLITLMFIDACAIPLVLYYTMTFVGHVQGWIVFAVVATIWGGPTYLEFALRSWRLIKKENFYRPLGSTSRWCFDFVHWLSVFSIASVTTLLIVGSAPHIVWLRVLSLPGPALSLCLGGGILFVTILSLLKIPAPFRISSTAKGEPVLPGVLYLIEDVVAVNANAGRPYREAVHARYNASPRFRQMVMDQSLFWGIPAVAIGIALIVVACVHEVDKAVAYGLGWGVPFFWALIWAFISVIWVKRDMRLERIAWEEDNDGDLYEAKRLELENPQSSVIPELPEEPDQITPTDSKHRGRSGSSSAVMAATPPRFTSASPNGDHDAITLTDIDAKRDVDGKKDIEELPSSSDAGGGSILGAERQSSI